MPGIILIYDSLKQNTKNNCPYFTGEKNEVWKSYMKLEQQSCNSNPSNCARESPTPHLKGVN